MPRNFQASFEGLDSEIKLPQNLAREQFFGVLQLTLPCFFGKKL